MRQQKLLTILLLITLTFSQVQQINKQKFGSIFGSNFEDFTSSSSNLNRQYFILFYLPEVDTSLDMRQLFHNVQQQYQRITIDTLKRRGITQFQQFESNMKEMMLLAQIDCGQNKEICEYFNIFEYPKLLYLAKNRKIYSYTTRMNGQDILSFVARHETHRIDGRFIKQHQVKSPLLSKVQSLFSSQILIYFLVFLIMPFAFGYFVMAKPVKQNLQKQKKDKKTKQEVQDKNKNKQKSN